MDEGQVVDDPEDDGSEEIGVPEAADVASTIADSDDAEWSHDESLDLDGTPWRPHLLRKDGKALVYVHLSDRLRSFATTRLKKASELGIEVRVAVPQSRLYDEELLSELLE